jgi:hypothetical protein
MKEFKCHKCGIYLGEMTQGKIKKNVIILCTECHSVYVSLHDYNKGTQSAPNISRDIPDFLKDLMSGKKN